MIRSDDTYEYKTVFTQEDVNAFAELTGDKNPIHIDLEYAKTTEYGKEVVQGMLIASAFSKVFGTMWPGTQDTLYISQDMVFLAPVYVGDQYTLKFVCLSVNEETSVGTIQATLNGDNDEIMVSLKARIKSVTMFSQPRM